MPAKNTVRTWAIPGYYHIYNRGAGNQTIFNDSQDRKKFLKLISRYITPLDDRDDTEPAYPYYPVEIVAYCLMNNHFHLLLYQQEDTESISGLMKSVSTAYTMYVNKKYKKSGHLFQGIFKASYINNETYLAHITRYIHMNPRTYKTYKWSSIASYLGGESILPVNSFLINDMTPTQYLEFLESYESRREDLDDIKGALAL